MSNIEQLRSAFPAQPVRGVGNPAQRPAPDAGQQQAGGADRVELSQQSLDAAARVRQDLVQRVRNEISAGTYLNEQRIDAIVDRVAQDLEQI